MSVIYTHLTYEQFKELERQMVAFRETTHKTEGGFYHKSIRLKVTDDLIMEFHGPLVGGYGHNVGEQAFDAHAAKDRNPPPPPHPSIPMKKGT